MYTISINFEGQLMQPVLLKDELPGQSLLEVFLKHRIPVQHRCGGICACSTCHVYILKGNEHLEESSRREKDFCKRAVHPQPNSRLSCQCLLLHQEGVLEIILPASSVNQQSLNLAATAVKHQQSEPL